MVLVSACISKSPRTGHFLRFIIEDGTRNSLLRLVAWGLTFLNLKAGTSAKSRAGLVVVAEVAGGLQGSKALRTTELALIACEPTSLVATWKWQKVCLILFRTSPGRLGRVR